MQTLRIYGPVAGENGGLTQLLLDFPLTTAYPELACLTHPGEFLGSIVYPNAYNDPLNQALATYGLTCDDFPDWA